MGLTRRDFLTLAGAGATWLGLGSQAAAAPGSSARQGIILGFGRGLDAHNGKPVFISAIADLDARNIGTVGLSFFGHGFARHPEETDRAIVLEKRGPGCCEISLGKREVTRTIPAPEGRHFYGHGTFSADGTLLFATQTILESHEGCIAVHDARSLREVGHFPTYGSNPHQCLTIDDGKTLVITNAGSSKARTRGNVAFVDVKTQKLVRKLVIPNAKLNAGHVQVSQAGDVVASSAPRDDLPAGALGGVSIRPAGGTFTTMDAPQEVIRRMVGESLSISVQEKRRLAAVTNPDGNIVTIWDIRRKKLVKSLDLPDPRGLTQTLDGENLVVSDAKGKLLFVPWETLVPGRPLPLGQTPFSGSHLYTLRSI